MKELDVNKTALTVGSFMGLMHLLWSVVVALGFAQGLMDFVFSLHFLNNPYTVNNFDVTLAAMLVVMTFVVGFLGGWIFARMWNMMMKRK